MISLKIAIIDVGKKSGSHNIQLFSFTSGYYYLLYIIFTGLFN